MEIAKIKGKKKQKGNTKEQKENKPTNPKWKKNQKYENT